MITLGDKVSYSFIFSLVAIKILKNVVASKIPKYNVVSDLVQDINMHESSFLWMTLTKTYRIGVSFYIIRHNLPLFLRITTNVCWFLREPQAKIHTNVHERIV